MSLIALFVLNGPLWGPNSVIHVRVYDHQLVVENVLGLLT